MVPLCRDTRRKKLEADQLCMEASEPFSVGLLTQLASDNVMDLSKLKVSVHTHRLPDLFPISTAGRRSLIAHDHSDVANTVKIASHR